jgi:hypothetical protein
MPPGLGWLAQKYPDARCASPRSADELRAFRSSFEVTFPPDYEAALRLTNAVRAGPVTIYGVGDVWTIPRPDGPFVAIASVRDVGDVTLKVGDTTGALYLLDSEGDEVRQLPGDFTRALGELLSAGSGPHEGEVQWAAKRLSGDEPKNGLRGFLRYACIVLIGFLLGSMYAMVQ